MGEVTSRKLTPTEQWERWEDKARQLHRELEACRQSRKAAVERIEALQGLLACYRTGRQPSETLHQKLERTRRALEGDGG